jgi:hypothetical protein
VDRVGQCRLLGASPPTLEDSMQTTMPSLVAHRRQFVVSRAAVEHPGWPHKPLDRGLVLSHCPTLPDGGEGNACQRREWMS